MRRRDGGARSSSAGATRSVWLFVLGIAFGSGATVAIMRAIAPTVIEHVGTTASNYRGFEFTPPIHARPPEVKTGVSPSPPKGWDALLEAISAVGQGPRRFVKGQKLASQLAELCVQQPAVVDLAFGALLQASEAGAQFRGAVLAVALGLVPDASVAGRLMDMLSRLKGNYLRTYVIYSLSQNRYKDPPDARGAGIMSPLTESSTPIREPQVRLGLMEHAKSLFGSKERGAFAELATTLNALTFSMGSDKKVLSFFVGLVDGSVESDDAARSMAISAIGMAQAPDALEAVFRASQDAHGPRQIEAMATALLQSGNRRYALDLFERFGHTEDRGQGLAFMKALASLKSDDSSIRSQAVSLVTGGLADHGQPALQGAAISAAHNLYGWYGETGLLHGIMRLAKSEKAAVSVRKQALRTLGPRRADSPMIRSQLRALFASPDENYDVRRAALAKWVGLSRDRRREALLFLESVASKTALLALRDEIKIALRSLGQGARDENAPIVIERIGTGEK